MKKAILSIGLFSMMMVLTSFSTNNEGGDLENPTALNSYDTRGVGASIGAGKKLDSDLLNAKLLNAGDTRGGASIAAGKKLD